MKNSGTLGGYGWNTRLLSLQRVSSSSANQSPSFSSSSQPQLSYLAWRTVQFSGSGKCLWSDPLCLWSNWWEKGSSTSMTFKNEICISTATKCFWKCRQGSFFQTLHGVQYNCFQTLVACLGFVNSYFWSCHDHLSRVRLEMDQNFIFFPSSLHYSFQTPFMTTELCRTDILAKVDN